ncbi:SpoIIE family protein phosphatase [Cellulomonas shaoxiangyii]|uniref:ATP-binding SpoIIE family protein phosphatase n=1 Tax=Cellulomonas shaoxiangyii TaxID=2566013 RepID=UPI00312CACC5
MVVNSHAPEWPLATPSDAPAGVAAELLAEALRATLVPTALLTASAEAVRVAWVNDALVAASGYAPNRVAALDVLTDRRVRPADVPAARAAFAAGVPFAQRVVLRRPDGAYVQCMAHVSPVGVAGLGVGAWVVALQDLTSQLTEHAEHTAVVEAERRERRSVTLIARVSDLLMDVDEPQGLREIASLLTAEVVGWAGFYLHDRGLWAADGLDPRRPGGAPRPDAQSRRLPTSGPRDPVGRLLGGRLDDAVELDLAAAQPDGTYAEWLATHAGPGPGDAVVGRDGRRAVGPPDRRVVVLPVPGRRRTLGLLVVQPRGGGGLAALDASTVQVLELVARRVGLSIDNVRLYDREHRLAETLQRAMLPEQGEVDGVDVWTYYSPSADDAQVGGDWYDVQQIGPDTVGVVVGDVVGHDVEAAAAMGQLRSVVRSYSVDITTPGPVLERVDQLFGSLRIPRAASLVLSTLDREPEGRWSLRYARAGHLPVLHVRDGHATQLRDAGGPLIGFGSGERATAQVLLEPGDVLVYYTDGLVERRDRSLRDGLTVLETVAAGITARDAPGIGEDLVSRLADHPEDDVAVVVVRVPDPDDHLRGTTSPRRRRWTLPSEPASIARARHAVVRTCEAWDVADPSNAELVVSELVANAVLHGWGHVALQLHDTGDGLRIEVEDSNPTPPVTTDGHPGRVGGFGMQIVERLSDWGWRQSRGGKVVWAKVRPGALPRSAYDDD